MFKPELIEINPNLIIEKAILTKGNYQEIYLWLKRDNQIVAECHTRKNLIINLNDEEITVFHSDVIVKIGNEYQVYSQRGFEYLLAELMD